MSCPERRSLVETLRDMTDNELLTVSVIISPLFLGAWAFVINQTIGSDSWVWFIIRFVLVFLVIPLLYCQGMLMLRKWETKQEKRQRDRKNLVARLKQKKNSTASIERVAVMDTEVTRELTEERIRELIDAFPGYFAACTIKPKTLDEVGRPGVRLVEESAE